MQENIILLQEFILETPAPNSEHTKQINRLKSIVTHYEGRIRQLEAELEKKKEG